MKRALVAILSITLMAFCGAFPVFAAEQDIISVQGTSIKTMMEENAALVPFDLEAGQIWMPVNLLKSLELGGDEQLVIELETNGADQLSVALSVNGAPLNGRFDEPFFVGVPWAAEQGEPMFALPGGDAMASDFDWQHEMLIITLYEAGDYSLYTESAASEPQTAEIEAAPVPLASLPGSKLPAAPAYDSAGMLIMAIAGVLGMSVGMFRLLFKRSYS